METHSADTHRLAQFPQAIARITDLLPDQVRVYRGIYDRFRLDGQSIEFAQVVVAQKTLASVVSNYLQSLNDAWMATVDLAELLQINDLMTMDGIADQAIHP